MNYLVILYVYIVLVLCADFIYTGIWSLNSVLEGEGMTQKPEYSKLKNSLKGLPGFIPTIGSSAFR